MGTSEPTLSELNAQIAEVSQTINNIVDDDFNYSEALLRQVHLEKCLADCLKAQASLDEAGARVGDFYRRTTLKYKTDPQHYAKELRALYNKAKVHNSMRAALSESSPKRVTEFEIPHAIEAPKGTWDRPAYQRSPAAILFARFKNYSSNKYHKRTHITVHGAQKHLASLQKVLTEMNTAEGERKKRWDILSANEDSVEAGLTIACEKLNQEANQAVWLGAYEEYAAYLRHVFQEFEKANETKPAQTLRSRPSFWKRHGKTLGTKASLLSLSKTEKRTPLPETAEDLLYTTGLTLPTSRDGIQTRFEGLDTPLPPDIDEMMKMKRRAAPTIRSIDDFRASLPPLVHTTATWQPKPSPMNAFAPPPSAKTMAAEAPPFSNSYCLSLFPPAKEITGSLTGNRRRNGFEKSHRSFEGYTEQVEEPSIPYENTEKKCLSPQEYYDQMFAPNYTTPAPFHPQSYQTSTSPNLPPWDSASLHQSLKLSMAKQRAAPSSSVYSPQGSEMCDSEREHHVYKRQKPIPDGCFRPSEPVNYFDNNFDDSDGLAAPAVYSDVENYSDEMSPLGLAATPNTPLDNDFYQTEPMTKPTICPCNSVYSSGSQDCCIESVAPLRLPSQSTYVRSL